LPERLAAEIKSAESRLEATAARIKAQVEKTLSEAEAATAKATRQVNDAAAERIRAAEAAVARFHAQAEEGLKAAEAASAQLASVQQRGLQGAERAGSTVMEGFAKAQKQIADFVTERIRHDIDAQTALLNCRSLEDVAAVQQRFFKTAMDHYSSEATRMMKLGGEVASRAIETAKR